MSIQRPNKEQNQVHSATGQRPGQRTSQMAERIGLATGRLMDEEQHASLPKLLLIIDDHLACILMRSEHEIF